MPATNIVDINGTPIVVGSKIKVDAIVVGINALASHFSELDIVFTNPGAAPQVNLPNGLGINDAGYQQAVGATSNLGPPGQIRGAIYPITTKISPTMVIVGV